jgi:hypothetical protein
MNDVFCDTGRSMRLIALILLINASCFFDALDSIENSVEIDGIGNNEEDVDPNECWKLSSRTFSTIFYADEGMN